MKKRSIALLVALSLCVGSAVGGTLAWLKASTSEVVNTFTIGDINIDLKEHDYDPVSGALTDTEVPSNDDYKYVPGATLPKDPFVTVKANSEACGLFVEVTEANNSQGTVTDVIEWSVDTSAGQWILVPGQTNVWYREVAATTEDTEFTVLADNKVTVSSDVTKDMVTNLNDNKPTLTFKAYAVQSANLKDGSNNAVTTAEAAWALAK